MHVTVHVGMALRIGAVHWREVACCSVCQCCGNSRSSVVETWHHSTRRLLVKVAICKLLVPQCSQQCLTWEMWHAHAIWFFMCAHNMWHRATCVHCAFMELGNFNARSCCRSSCPKPFTLETPSKATQATWFIKWFSSVCICQLYVCRYALFGQ